MLWCMGLIGNHSDMENEISTGPLSGFRGGVVHSLQLLLKTAAICYFIVADGLLQMTIKMPSYDCSYSQDQCGVSLLELIHIAESNSPDAAWLSIAL